jgi:cytochrome c oxidase subunit IV
MVLKAGLIMAIVMHMAWERLALTLAIVLPPLALMVFVGIMVSESDYTFFTREEFFGAWIPGEGELHEGAAHE